MLALKLQNVQVTTCMESVCMYMYMYMYMYM